MTTSVRPRRRRRWSRSSRFSAGVVGRQAVELRRGSGGRQRLLAGRPAGVGGVRDAREGAAGRSGINDVSCLNPDAVHGIVTVREVEDVRQAFAMARTYGVKVSIAGARHSQGGHAFAPNNIVLDMRSFNRMSLDETAGLLTVQSGATWHDIQNRLHPQVRGEGDAVHRCLHRRRIDLGQRTRHGPSGGIGGPHVRAMRVMLADGVRPHRQP